jgi:hypothetical protein
MTRLLTPDSMVLLLLRLPPSLFVRRLPLPTTLKVALVGELILANVRLNRNASVPRSRTTSLISDDGKIRLLLKFGSVAHDSVGSELASLSIGLSGTELEFHALSRSNSTVFAIELLVGRAARLCNRDTILSNLIMCGARWTLGRFVCNAFVAIEIETLRALRIHVGEAVLSVKVGSLGAERLLTHTGLAIESKFSTVRGGTGDTLAIFEDESRLAVLFNDASTPSILPKELLRTFRTL